MSFDVPRVRRGIVLAVAAAALSVCVLPLTSASAATKLRIGYNPNPTNTTIIVAQQQGFFAKRGLDVSLTPCSACSGLVPAVGKQFDLLTSTPTDAIRGLANGLKPVVVQGETAEWKTNESTQFIVKPGINSITDLKGKAIAIPGPAGALYLSALIAFNKAGMKPTDAKFVSVPFASMGDQLKAGQVDAVLTVSPFQKQILAAGFKKLPNPILAATGNKMTLSASWIANRDWANKNRKTIDAFRAAQKDALAWMKTHDAEARQVLVKEFHLPQVAANAYPLLNYVYFKVQQRFFDVWVKPMEDAGLIRKGSIKTTKSLIYPGS